MAQAVIMPKAGMSMETGTILRWLKKPGEPVRRGEPLLEIETDKLAMEVEAEIDGVLLAITRSAGEVVPVTVAIGWIGAPGEAVPTAETGAAGHAEPARPAPAAHVGPAGQPVPTAPAGALAGSGPIRASPLARSVARQRGLDLRGIAGSGPGGAVRVRDLPQAAPAASAGPERRPLGTMRRAIAARMTRSHREIPAVTLHAEADITHLEAIRESWNTGAGGRIPLTPFLLKAAALGCRNHPLLRSMLDGDDLVTHAVVDLGMAVALDTGLIVPVIRGADALTVARLADAAREMARRAREGKLKPDEVSGAVFSVTNLGMFGVTSFDPLIDPPQSAILGIGATRPQPVVVGGQVEVHRVVDLALTFDHRVLDGAQAAVALKDIREALESPLRLLL